MSMHRFRHWPVIAGLLTMAAILVFAAGSARGESLEKARTLMKAGEVNRAITVLSSASKAAPAGEQRAKLLNAQGWLEYRKGRSTRSDQLYRQALKEAEKTDNKSLTVKIRNNMGINHFVAGRINDAEKVFLKAKTQGSTVAPRYLVLITQHRKMTKVNEHIRTGIAHRLRGQFSDAIKEYSQALKMEGDNVNALEYRGYAYFRAGNLVMAEKDLLQAYRIDTGRTNTLINLAKVYCKRGNQTEIDQFVTDYRDKIDPYLGRFRRDSELRRTCGNKLAALNLW